MATIEQLIVKLALDATEFDAGSKTAISAFKKSGEQAIQTGNTIEAAGKKAAESFGKVTTEVLALIAAFAGVGTLKNFVEGIVESDAAIGRLARSMDMSVKSLSQWQGAAKMLGGTSEGITSALASIRDGLEQFRISGSSSITPFLSKMGIAAVDATGKIRDSGDILKDMAKWAKGQDPATATSWLRNIIPNEDAIADIIQGPEALQKAMDASARHGIVSDKDTAAAKKLLSSISALQQSVTSFGRAIVTDASPYVSDLIDQLDDWIDKNRDWIAQNISDKIKEFGEWLKKVDWDQVKKGATDFAGKVTDLVGNIESLIGKITGTDGLNPAFAALAVILTTRLLGPLGILIAGLGFLSSFGVPEWLSKFLGVDPVLTGAAGAGDAIRRGLGYQGDYPDPSLIPELGSPEFYRDQALGRDRHRGPTLAPAGGRSDDRPWYQKAWDWGKKKVGLGDPGPGPGVSGVDVNTKLADLDARQRDQLAAALVASEGPGISDRNNNPGNLRYAGQPGATPGEGGFARFETREAGMAAMRDLVFNGRRYRDKTILEAMRTYSPVGDGANNPDAKAAFIARRIGAPASAVAPATGAPTFWGPNKVHDSADDRPSTPYGSLVKAMKDFRTAPGVMPIQPNAFLNMASAAAAANAYSTYNTTTTNSPSTSTSQTHIGAINVTSSASDPAGLVRDLGPYLQRSNYVGQADGGPR